MPDLSGSYRVTPPTPACLVPSHPLAAAVAALARAAALAGCPITLVESDSRPWWSATYAGDAVWLTIAAEAGETFDRWLATLPDAELSIADRFVADCHVERASETALVSLLILDTN